MSPEELEEIACGRQGELDMEDVKCLLALAFNRIHQLEQCLTAAGIQAPVYDPIRHTPMSKHG